MIKKLFSLSVITLISSTLAFVFLPLISASLSLSAFADYSFYYTVISVLASVCLFGSTPKYSLAIAENDNQKAIEVIRFFISSNLFFILIATLLIIIFIWFFNQPWLLLIIPLLISCRSLFQLTSHYFRVHNRVKLFSIYQLVTLSCIFILPLGVAQFFNLQGLEFIALMGGVMFTSGLFGLRFLKNRYLLKGGLINPVKASCAKFGFFAAGHSLAAALITIADRFILISNMEKEKFAVYSLAAILAAALSLVFTIINQNLAPEFYRSMKKTEKPWRTLKRYFLYYMLFVLTVFIIFEISIGSIVYMFFPESYQAAVPYARWLAIGALIQGSYFFASSLLLFLERSERLFFITLGVGIFSVVCGLVMYKFLGVMGVVYSYIFTWFLFSSITFYVGIKGVAEYVSES